MNAYDKFVQQNYDQVRKFPSHERFKELAKMWHSTSTKPKKSAAKKSIESK